MNNGVVILSWQRCLHKEEEQPEQNVWRTLCSTSGEQLCCEIIILSKLEMRKRAFATRIWYKASFCSVRVWVERNYNNVWKLKLYLRKVKNQHSGVGRSRFDAGLIQTHGKRLGRKISYAATCVTCSSSGSACLADFVHTCPQPVPALTRQLCWPTPGAVC